MLKYILFVKKHFKKILVSIVITNILALIGVFQLHISTDFSMFGSEDSVYTERMARSEELFGNSTQIVILVEQEGELTMADINNAISLTAELESVAGVSRVETIPSVIPVQGTSGITQVPIEQLSFDQINAYLTGLGTLSPVYEYDTKTYISYTLILDDDNFHRASLKSVESILQTNTNLPFFIAGDKYNQIKVFDYIILILAILVPLTMITILSIFFTQMRSFKATIFSVIPAGFGALWTMGLLGWIGKELSLITVIVPVLIIVIGSADGLHFMSHMQEEFSDQKSNVDGLAHTLKMVGIPMIITTVTSVVGFLALLTMPVAETKSLAIGAAIGITFAGIATWLVLPLILLKVKELGSHKQAKNRNIVTVTLKRFQGLPSYLFALLIIVASIIFYPNIKSEFNTLMIYKSSTEVSENATQIQDIVGGSIPHEILIDLPSTFGSMESYTLVTNLQNALEDTGVVSKMVSPYIIMDDIATRAGITINDTTLPMIIQNVYALGEETISSFYNSDANVVRLMVFTTDLNNETLQKVEDVVNQENAAEITGVQFILKEVNTQVIDTQLTSIIIALGAVYLMMLITLRSFKLSLLSIVPILISIVGLYGFLGISGISLNLQTMIIFSITIGVGIDYAIHYVSVYKTFHKEEGLSPKEASEKAYYYTSKPLFTNALGISTGLTILLLSPITIHTNVCILMWVSMTMSVILTLTLLPTLLKKFKR